MDNRKVIRDSVHNLIDLSGNEGKLLVELIDTPEFQRLRRIRQLGLAFLVYPGAEHSRWTHSVGVCHVTRRMLDSLKVWYTKDSDEYAELKNHRRELLVAALLHDIGHGPLSHVFERAIPPPIDTPDDYPTEHEDWSQKIIKEKFYDIIGRHEVNVDVVVNLLNKKNRNNLLAKDFISSQLDADRMDYLLRDSRATGPKYGEFDLEWLLHSLRIGMKHVPGSETGTWRLCLESSKAIHVLEEYIQAREFMYKQVYFHKTTRSYESLLKNIIGLASNICNGDPDRVPKPCPPVFAKMLAKKTITTDEYLTLDDYRLWNTFIDWSNLDGTANEPIKLLAQKCSKIVHRKQPYKSVELDTTDKIVKATQLIQSLKHNDSNLQYNCSVDLLKDHAYRNASYRKSKEAEEQEDRVIYLLENGTPKPAENLSQMIDAISKFPMEYNRLYYDSDNSNMVDRLREEGWINHS